MTAIAYDYRADRVVLASDSAVFDDAGAHHGYGPKIHAFPTSRSAFFSRGKSHISLRVVQLLLIKPTLHTLEDQIEALPKYLTLASREFYKGHGLDVPDGNYYEALIVGWSEAEQRMRSASFYALDGFVPHTEHDKSYGGPFCWPLIPQECMPMDRSADTTEQKLLAVLNAIDTWAIAHADEINNYRLGGDVQCVTLHEASISYRTIGTVGLQPAKPKAAGKPKKGRK